MAGRLEGKVAFITGAARGQGRSHALRLAQEGADIIAVDLCSQVESVRYPMATPEDLAETVRQVEATGQRIVATCTDVRDAVALEQVVGDGVSQLGRLDIVAANAGISNFGVAWKVSEVEWRDVVDINLTGVWHTAKVAIPHLIDSGHGGSIVLTGSTGSIVGLPNAAHYTAAKHGVVGLMKTLAQELAPHMIRVNSIHPAAVDTAMIQNPAIYGLFAPDLSRPTREDIGERFKALNALPIPWVEPVDISNALLFLASDDARYITGVALPIDAGSLTVYGQPIRL